MISSASHASRSLGDMHALPAPNDAAATRTTKRKNADSPRARSTVEPAIAVDEVVWDDEGKEGRKEDPNAVVPCLWHRHVVDSNYEVSVWPGSRCLSGRRRSRVGDGTGSIETRLKAKPTSIDRLTHYEIMINDGDFYRPFCSFAVTPDRESSEVRIGLFSVPNIRGSDAAFFRTVEHNQG